MRALADEASIPAKIPSRRCDTDFFNRAFFSRPAIGGRTGPADFTHRTLDGIPLRESEFFAGFNTQEYLVFYRIRTNPSKPIMSRFRATSLPATETIRWIKKTVEDNNLDSFSQCSEGCSYCCYQMVCLTVFEAIELAKGLETLSDSAREDVLAQAKINVKANNKISHDGERWLQRLPCPLLKNQRCSVYEHRPIGCRATTSADQQCCRRQYEKPELEGHRPPSVIVEGLTPDDRTIMQFRLAFQQCSDQTRPNLQNLDLAGRLDLDRFLEYYCVPNAATRQYRLKKLAAIDRDTLKKLNKRTEPPYL